MLSINLLAAAEVKRGDKIIDSTPIGLQAHAEYMAGMPAYLATQARMNDENQAQKISSSVPSKSAKGYLPPTMNGLVCEAVSGRQACGPLSDVQ
jgi:hypothetical protein